MRAFLPCCWAIGSSPKKSPRPVKDAGSNNNPSPFRFALQVVTAFVVLREVETFGLLFLIHSQTDHCTDQLEENE